MWADFTIPCSLSVDQVPVDETSQYNAINCILQLIYVHRDSPGCMLRRDTPQLPWEKLTLFFVVIV